MKKIVFFIGIALFVQITFAQETTNTKWAKDVKAATLKNLHQLNNEIFRSEQPTKKSFKELEKLGIKSSLNLRKYKRDNCNAGKSGVKLFRVKMWAPNIKEQEVVIALKILKDAPKPIVIHCKYGSDRTGLICAMYRIVFENWTKKEAIDELRNGGFGFHEKYENILQFIENCDIDSIKKQVLI